MTRTGARHRRIDQALLALVRLVCDEQWTVAAAGERLWAEVPDGLALRGARARVLASLAERPSALGERSVAILDAALALGSTRTMPDDPARLSVQGSSTC